MNDPNKIDLDVVDLSVGSMRDTPGIAETTARDLRALTQNSSLTITPTTYPPVNTDVQMYRERPMKRILRPRTEVKSYAEVPDIVLLPVKSNGRSDPGDNGSDSDEEEIRPVVPIKELSAAEIWERERALRKLREELRNEETKLVLLKKLKQSQQMMKENIIITPINNQTNTNVQSCASKSSLTVTPTTNAAAPAKPRVQPTISRTPQQPLSLTKTATYPRTSLPGGATLTPGTAQHRSNFPTARNTSNFTITPSVTITPTSAPPVGAKQRYVPPNNANNSVSISPAPPAHASNEQIQKPAPQPERQISREEVQTPAQRQAAAKLALRKQLEKTLLQIPPPKPPPPEMHFIPNPSNTEFVYLLGLETVVDYITKDKKNAFSVIQPFRCAQCKIDFTPVWKWEKQGKIGNATFQNTPACKDPKVICEQCVTSNVKKALKAEHTNRLKTAFVKALQQEQEIEQRLATQNSPSPVESHPPVTVSVAPAPPQQPQPPPPPPPVKPQTPTPAPRPTPPPPPPPQQQQQQQPIQQPPQQQVQPPPPPQPTPPPSTSRQRHESMPNAAAAASAATAAQLSAIANLGSLGGNVNASLLQAFHQQVFRGLQQGLSGTSANAQAQAHMMQFNPLLYSYQLSMAHQALASAGKTLNVNELQRLAEMQRQYLLEMIPQQTQNNSNNRQSNWKS